MFKFNVSWVVLGISACLWLTSAQAAPLDKPLPEESWFVKRLANSGKFILENEGHHVWGAAPIYDDEGKVHVYFSIWKEGGHWLTDSKIAHAVADHPEGPYQVLGTILKGRGQGYWDADSIHNPSVYRVDGKYVLLYIGNNVSKQEKWRKKAPAANTQRIGMAVSDSPYGPWKRSEKPVVDVSGDPQAWDGYCTVNPSFLKHPNGEYWIYYRAWDRRNDDRRKTGVAMAKSLQGPYVKYKHNPVIDFPEKGGQSEDPFMFYYRGKFHTLIRDMGNYDWLGGLYLQSDDGLSWSDYQRGYYQGSTYLPISDKKRFERVQLLFKNGEPEYMFNAVERDDGSTNAAVLKINPGID